MATPGNPAAPSLRQSEAVFRELAHKTLRSYVALYRRRAQRGEGRAFRMPEQNALAALVVQRAAAARPRDFEGDEAVRLMEDLSQSVFQGTRVAAADIVGHAWADAYGVLPLETPPLQLLDSVVVSGAHAGAIGGLYGAAWRGLFLASAIPLLPAGTRSLGVEQFHRWTDYIRPRVATMAAAEPPVSASEFSQRARIGAVIAEIAHRVGDDPLLRSVTALVKPLLGRTGGGAVPTVAGAALAAGHVAQLATAATSIGEPGLAADLLDRLAVACFDAERALFHIGENREHVETSPWVPIAIAALVHPAAEPRLSGSRFRRALDSARRRPT